MGGPPGADPAPDPPWLVGGWVKGAYKGPTRGGGQDEGGRREVGWGRPPAGPTLPAWAPLGYPSVI